MGRAEAGAYLQEVRVLRRLSRQHLAARIGISDDRIEEFEKGRGNMNGPALLRLIRAVGASYEQVTALLDDAQATIEQAREHARAWLLNAASDREPPAMEAEADELYAIALQRTNGDRRAARQLLLRAIEELLDE